MSGYLMSEKIKNICTKCGFEGEGLIYRPRGTQRLNKPTLWYCPECNTHQKYENKNKTRNRILKFLYDSKMDNNNEISGNDITERLLISEDELESNLNYLEEEELLKIGDTTFDGFDEIEITSKGINRIEGNDILTSTINQVNIQDSPGTVYNSSNVSVNISNSFIEDSFNTLYQTINESEHENKAKITEKIQELEMELQKDEINKSKVQECNEWLQRNANWTIPTITQIILVGMGLGG